tara:strand:+ start:1772 stop:2920 length:1149 start_codon:yes stop_codon:yes gene_type:complete
MRFKEIPGNKTIKQRLIEGVINNRVSHAQLFIGESGSAKLALALAYARFLNCESRMQDDSCENCPSCIKYKNLNHPDHHLIFPILKLKQNKKHISEYFLNEWKELVLENPYISLDDWIKVFDSENKSGNTGMIYKDQATRVREMVQLKNYESRYRTIIIWLPEKMNKETSNKLLKLLEEPPIGTIFIAVSEDKKKLLKTIVSRLQTVRVLKPTTQDIQTFFTDKNPISIEEARKLYKLTDGDLGKVIQIKTTTMDSDFFGDFSTLMRIAYKSNVQAISDWVDGISKEGRKNQILFCSYSIKIIRDCWLLSLSKKTQNNSEKEHVFISNFSKFINNKNVQRLTYEFEDVIKGINRNGSSKILFFNLSLQIIKLLMIKPKFVKK